MGRENAIDSRLWNIEKREKEGGGKNRKKKKEREERNGEHREISEACHVKSDFT